MPIHRSRLRSLAIALPLAASLGACTTWSRQRLPAPGEDRFFATARVTRADGAPIELDNVTVGQDSVVGRMPSGRRVALPVSEVRMVEARRTDPFATLATVVLAVAGALAVWAAIVISTIGTGS
jgi:hypothetical protein